MVFAVSVVIQHMHSSKEIHMETIYWILRCFKGSSGPRLFFQKNGNKEIVVFTDADWAGSLENRRSTAEYCTLVWGNLVTWRNKKQNVVARSSVEAELGAIAQGTCEELWLKKLLEELKITIRSPIKLYCNNKVAINISFNPIQHDRTKQV